MFMYPLVSFAIRFIDGLSLVYAKKPQFLINVLGISRSSSFISIIFTHDSNVGTSLVSDANLWLINDLLLVIEIDVIAQIKHIAITKMLVSFIY